MNLSTLWILLGALILVEVLIALLFIVWMLRRRKKVKNAITRLTSGTQEISAEEFMNMRKVREGRRKISNQSDFTGIYIIHNMTKNIYYVGQSKTVLKRVTSHFGGHGNGDIYADLKYGDAFSVKAISLADSGYINLDALERDAIQAYDAFENGYNKNRGNRTYGWC